MPAHSPLGATPNSTPWKRTQRSYNFALDSVGSKIPHSLNSRSTTSGAGNEAHVSSSDRYIPPARSPFVRV